MWEAIGSMAAGLFSAAMSSLNMASANAEKLNQRAMFERQKAEQEGWFNKRYYQDITERTEVLDMLRKLEEANDESSKKEMAANTVLGASNEAKLASTDSRNKSTANFLSSVASDASMLKDTIANDYVNRLERMLGTELGISDKIAGVYENKSDQWGKGMQKAFDFAFNSAK